MFQLRLLASSRVRDRYRMPANRATNGCAPPVAACQQWITSQGPGASWSFQAPVPNPCPASILPSSSAAATTTGECNTIAGAECDRAAQAESPRLLAHEQGHFDLACRLVNKADDALRSGATQAAVAGPLSTKTTAATTAYDNQTNHGCDAAAQARWLADIAAGLPAITIP